MVTGKMILQTGAEKPSKLSFSDYYLLLFRYSPGNIYHYLAVSKAGSSQLPLR
jgi:hypothetical protein